MRNKKFIAFGTIVMISLVGCSSKESLSGTREALILVEHDEVTMDDDHGEVIVDSSEEKNTEFVQAHFNVSHHYAPLNFSPAPTEFWSAKLDFEATKSIKMTASPVVAGGKVFCIDAAGVVHAFDQNTGKKMWTRSTTVVGKDGQIGGAIAYDKGRLLVTSSFAEGFSLDAESGKILWRIKLPAPCKGDGITIHDGKAFILCSNSSLHSVDIDT
ncbi:MAG: PQQ-binding-like beta-propeller repeat protein, partial [Holosporaceae bacterium]|nr:PQQ-binding-like beta-propeller repeat protein [Holosporaceae bacterium]